MRKFDKIASKLIVWLIPFSYLLVYVSCNIVEKHTTNSKEKRGFEVVGYLHWSEGKGGMDQIAYQYLTTIIYSKLFLTPNQSGNLMPVRYPDTLHSLVKHAHAHDVKVFVYVGGFEIGDGPGMDTRLENATNTKTSRNRLVHSAMKVVRKFDLDGIDIDWEFPDAVEPSLSNFVLLMKELSDSLHPVGKKLTAAVESHHLPYAYGIDQASFRYVDWFNIMTYDGDVGHEQSNSAVLHSPYWLSEIAFNCWISERGLPKEKAVMGVPFYGKGAGKGVSYRSLLAQGADPYADVYDGIYYNGIKTIQQKTELAQRRGGGIMIWEISSDTTGQFSLLKAIHDAVK